MPNKAFTPEQIVPKLRQVSAGRPWAGRRRWRVRKRGHRANSLPVAERIRWPATGTGPETEGSAKGDAQLRRVVADLMLEKQILKDIAQGNL